MASTSTDSAGSGGNKPRVPWYRNPNWLLLAVVVVVGIWLLRLFAANREAAPPVGTSPTVAATPTPVARVYQKPVAPARILQHAYASGAASIADAHELRVKLAAAPKAGDLLLAFGSAGFGCVPAPGWTLVGGRAGDAVAVAYRVAQAGDGKILAPFTTARANDFTLDVTEVAGGPDIVASAQAGGSSTPLSSITNTLALPIPQTGGILFQLYAGTGNAGRNGPPTQFADTVPPGQAQTLVDRVPAYGWGSELVVRATTTEPQKAKQPFAATQTMTFASHKAPGNIVTGWLVWVGGRLGAP